jgi:ATP adenylyltransferase
MRRLWTPWRFSYIREQHLASGCIFCNAGRVNGSSNAPERDDQESLVVHRARYSFILLNRYPYTSGHVMIAPYQHVSRLSQVGDEVVEEIMRSAKRMESVLEQLYRPAGLNVGMNLGEAAGAGIEQHIHLHVLPRWHGDANFMTTIGDTRVLPELLEVSYSRIRGALAA